MNSKGYVYARAMHTSRLYGFGFTGYFTGGWNFHGTVFASGFHTLSHHAALDPFSFLDHRITVWCCFRVLCRTSFSFFDAQCSFLFCVDHLPASDRLFTFLIICPGSYVFRSWHSVSHRICKGFFACLCFYGIPDHLRQFRVVIPFADRLWGYCFRSVACLVLAAVPGFGKEDIPFRFYDYGFLDFLDHLH